MTTHHGRPAPSPAPDAEDDVSNQEERRGAPEPTAADFLGPILLALIEGVQTTSRRVIASGEGSTDAAADDEAVHDFRVTLRRLRTLLGPARRTYGKKKLRHVTDGLRAFAHATGALRDQEVLRETLSALELDDDTRAAVDAWLAQRVQQEQTARAHVITVLRLDLQDDEAAARRKPSALALALRLEPHLAKLKRRILRRKAKPRGARELGQRTIDDALSDLRALATSDPADGAAMHALRIRFKRLRYSAETFAPLLGEHAEHLARAASRMQRRLGQLHDLDEALARLTDDAGSPELSPQQRAAVLTALGVERTRLVEKLTVELPNELQLAIGRP